MPADGSALPRVVGPGLQPAFSPDGRSLAVHLVGAEERFEIWLLGLSGGQEPRVFLRESTSVRFPAFSPDGRFVSYLQGEGEATGNIAFGNTMMTRFPEAQGRWQISTRGGDFGTWSPDGRRFYYIARAERDAVARHLMEVDVRTSPEVSLVSPPVRPPGAGPRQQLRRRAGRSPIPDGARGRRPDDREARARPELVRGVPMIAPGHDRWVACASDESGRHEAWADVESLGAGWCILLRSWIPWSAGPSRTTASRRSSAAAGWVSCIGPRTCVWADPWRSSSCPMPWPGTAGPSTASCREARAASALNHPLRRPGASKSPPRASRGSTGAACRRLPRGSTIGARRSRIDERRGRSE